MVQSINFKLNYYFFCFKTFSKYFLVYKLLISAPRIYQQVLMVTFKYIHTNVSIHNYTYIHICINNNQHLLSPNTADIYLIFCVSHICKYNLRQGIKHIRVISSVNYFSLHPNTEILIHTYAYVFVY